MAESERSLRALGAAMRAALNLDTATPSEMHELVLRLARAQVSRLPAPHRTSA